MHRPDVCSLTVLVNENTCVTATVYHYIFACLSLPGIFNSFFFWRQSLSFFKIGTAQESLKCPEPPGYRNLRWYYSQVVTDGSSIAKALEGFWVIKILASNVFLIWKLIPDIWCLPCKKERCVIREQSHQSIAESQCGFCSVEQIEAFAESMWKSSLHYSLKPGPLSIKFEKLGS